MSGKQTDAEPTDSSAQRATDCCSTSSSLPDADTADDVQTLSTMGNDTRYEALRLVARSDDGVCVCELEGSLGVSQGAVSQALSRLFSAGLVERRKEGRWRDYTATPRAGELLRVLDDTRQAGRSGGE